MNKKKKDLTLTKQQEAEIMLQVLNSYLSTNLNWSFDSMTGFAEFDKTDKTIPQKHKTNGE